jgi:hypothetical protein
MNKVKHYYFPTLVNLFADNPSKIEKTIEDFIEEKSMSKSEIFELLNLFSQWLITNRKEFE